jgi:hypothetical protein
MTLKYVLQQNILNTPENKNITRFDDEFLRIFRVMIMSLCEAFFLVSPLYCHIFVKSKFHKRGYDFKQRFFFTFHIVSNN